MKRSQNQSCISHPTVRLLSRVRRSQSMVAKRLCDPYRIGSDDLEKAHSRCWGSKLRRRRTMSNKLEGKIALITGGSRGIGAAIAKRLAADGANVAITYTKGADAAASVVKEIERAGGKAIAIQADAADADASKAAVEKTVATFGRLDVLVNNAGSAIPKAFEETTLEELDRLIDVNVRGTLVATQAALKHMKSGGRIIIICSSGGGRVQGPRRGPPSRPPGDGQIVFERGFQ